MLYVLTLGWVWFAAAGALGLLVGFATATRGRGGEFSGWWVILAAFGVLAGGFAGAELGLVPGHAGLQLEIGLLAALAYFFGLPIGGGAKSLLPAPAAAPIKPIPVVVRGRPRDEEEAPALSTPAPNAPAPTPPVPEPPAPEPPAPVSPAPEPPPAKSETADSETAAAAPEPAAKAPPAKKHFPGRPPERLAGPRGGTADDLTRIKGIGPKSVEKLHALGVFHFDQIAAWNIDNARWIGAALSAPGRVERGKWIQQAREHVAAKEPPR
jgi:predicted flap endonuclease-1-like 5' DNA nuclease